MNKITNERYNADIAQNITTLSNVKSAVIIGSVFVCFTIIIYVLTTIINNMMYCEFTGLYCNKHNHIENKSKLYVETVNKFLMGGIFIYYSATYAMGLAVINMIGKFNTTTKYLLTAFFVTATTIGMIYGPIGTPIYWLVRYGVNVNV
jgi:hypothetical protein